MIYEWDSYYVETLVEAAREMALAARTAPKGRGRDQLHILILTAEDKEKLADHMERIGTDEVNDIFLRDAQSLRRAPVLLLLGTETSPMELKHCGYCGWEDCQENRDRGTNPCAFSVGDLGIAMGSAVSLAARRHIDNRIFFTAGRAALEIGIFPGAVRLAYGIPLSATGKNPFFDRKRK